MTIPKPMLVITAIIFATLLAACSFSTEDLAEEVKSDMEERFEGERIEIESLILTHKGGNEYKGVLETKSHMVNSHTRSMSYMTVNHFLGRLLTNVGLSIAKH